MDTKKIISKLPINSYHKLLLFKKSRQAYWYFKLNKEEYLNQTERSCLFPQNYYYGHEYWIRKYASYENTIYGMIEHGFNHADDKSKIGWDAEWDSGNIITFGDSRLPIFKELYPDYNILRIGPRLHYADMDRNYYNEIKSKLSSTGKTIVLYPSHSIENIVYTYDIEMFVRRAVDFAKHNGITNILVSLHPQDIFHGFDAKYREIAPNIIPVTGGSDNLMFLPRLKAILSIADITYSNLVGTHVGYSIYMGKPHVIDSASDNQKSETVIQYNKATGSDFMASEQQFANMFDGKDPWNISKEQYDFIDFHFGLHHVKSPEEMNRELYKCEQIFKHRFNLK